MSGLARRRRRAAYLEAMRELYGDAVIRAYGYRIPGRRLRRRAGGLCAPGLRAAVTAEAAGG